MCFKVLKRSFFGYSTNQEQGTVDETRIEPLRSRNQCPSSFQLYQKVHTFVSAICSHYMCKLHNIACYVVCGHVKYIVWRFDCGLIFAHHSTVFKINIFARNTVGHNNPRIALKLAISGPFRGAKNSCSLHF